MQHHSNQLASRQDFHKHSNDVQMFYAHPPGSGQEQDHPQHQHHPQHNAHHSSPMYGNMDSMPPGRDNRVIAKPLPNRPTPFIAAAAAAAAATGHGSLNHPHLHSLLTHCRNPYLGGGGPGAGGGEWLETELRHLHSNRLSSMLTANVPGQMFPLPGPGFPWAHSNRGKPRRGMMRRAVFSGEQHLHMYLHKLAIQLRFLLTTRFK